jgi:hypothetical protein
MNVPEILDAVQFAGGSLALNGERIQYVLPDSATWLITELKRNRKEVVELLRKNRTPPLMPPGVQLVRWERKKPPIAIVRMGIVSDVDKFVNATLRELRAKCLLATAAPRVVR